MLSKITIRGFRAIKDSSIELPQGKPLVLIGENASGKSAILDALAVIAAFARGDGGDALYERGGWSTVAWQGTAQQMEFELEFAKDSPYFREDKGVVRYVLVIGRERGTPTVVREQLTVQREEHETPFVVLQGGARSFFHSARTKQRHPVMWPASISRSGASERLLRNTALSVVPSSTEFPTPQHMQEALASIASYPGFSLRPDPKQPLGAQLVERSPRISEDGRNLLVALHTLFSSSPDRWEDLVDDVRAVFPWVGPISFPPLASMRGHIGLLWIDLRSNTQLGLDDMSEGMRVFLATLAALYADDHPVLLAFDEPERNLHPKALQRLMSVVEVRSEQTPVLLATHSDRLLDFLGSPVDSLAICRFEDESGARVERLDPKVLTEWLKDFSLSELRRRRSFDAPKTRSPKPSHGAQT